MIKLCKLSQLNSGDAKGFELEGQRLLVVERAGKYYVYRNLCPHRGVSLEWVPDQFLDLDKDFIQCATHGALFRIENGLCIQGPCLGQSLEVVGFRIKNDELWVEL